MTCIDARHLADLVEEERAAVGDLEEAAALGVGAGEGAAHVAEERGLEQRLGDGGAGLGDERLAAARAVVVDGARDELLAGAALAVDDDGERGVGHAVEQAEELEHARRPANQVVIVVADGERGAARAHLLVQLAELDAPAWRPPAAAAVERVDLAAARCAKSPRRRAFSTAMAACSARSQTSATSASPKAPARRRWSA